MKRGKVGPEGVSFDNKAYEMSEIPNNQANVDQKNVGDQLKIIANVGMAAAKWQQYTNSRRKAKGKSALSRSSDGEGLAPDLNEEMYGCYQTEVDGTANVIKSQMETAPNRNMIQYFARLSDPSTLEQVVDLEFVCTLVENGADINCTDMYGQSVLHEVARTWHTDVARFLIKELGADPNQGDRWGRTPLHVAASVDYSEMCEYLIDAGADKESRTAGESQTPLFFAARNDAVTSMKTLIKRGCEFKRIVDYRQRTPLMVAAELDRSETAAFLLELGAPADVRDDSGQPVMVPLIMKMAPVAKEALNQFHQKDRPNRKQYYYLGRLDPTRPEELNSKKYQSALQVAVTNHQFDLLMHAAFIRMIKVKWDNFAKWRAYGQLCFQFVYILSWSIFGIDTDWTVKYKYNLPQEGWRIFIFVVAVGFTVWQIIEEIVEYRSSHKKFENWKEWRLQEIARDEAYCHPRWPEEREYLQQEKDELDDMAPSYLADAWNLFDWLCYFLLMVCIITHLIDVFDHSLIIARWHIRIMAVTIIILWLRFMKVCRAFALLGPFIVILGHILTDVIKFVFLYMDFYIPFAFAFWMLLGGVNIEESYYNTADYISPNATQIVVSGFANVHDMLFTLFRLTLVDEYDYSVSRSPFAFWMILGGDDNIAEVDIINGPLGPNVTFVVVSGFDTWNDMLFTMFRLTLVDEYDYENMIKVDHIMAQLLIGAWLALSAILCVNLFIALLSDTFVRVYDNAQANAVMQKAITILNIMDNLSGSRREEFHRYLLEQCNPESLYYDDDVTTSGEDDMKKATIEVRDIVTEMKEKFDVFFGDEEFRDDQIFDHDGMPMTSRRKSLISAASIGAFGKNIEDNISPFISSQLRNLNMVSVDTFEQEIDSLREQLVSLRDQQIELNERVKRDMAGIKSVLQDIALVITDLQRPRGGPPGTPGAGDVDTETLRRRRSKKRRGESEDLRESSTPRGVLQVAPAAPPMQIETYTPDGATYLPPVTFPEPPGGRETEDV